MDAGRWLIKGMPIPGEAEDWWAHFWTSDCSFPERTGAYHHVQMNTDFLTAQQRKAHPMTADDNPEMMLVLPNGGGRTLRMLAVREDGPRITEDDPFLLLLLMPHIERMYRPGSGNAPARRCGSHPDSASSSSSSSSGAPTPRSLGGSTSLKGPCGPTSSTSTAASG